MINLAVTNKILGEVYILMSFPNQAMRIIEGTPNAHPIEIETLRRIHEGIKNGNMTLTQSLYMSNVLGNVERQVEKIKMEIEYYKEHDEFLEIRTDNARNMYEKLVHYIPNLKSWVESAHTAMKKIDPYLVDLEKMLSTAVSDPKYIELSQKVKHSSFLSMKGEVIVPLDQLFVYHMDNLDINSIITSVVLSKSEVSYFHYIVLKKLLENYIAGFPLRKPYIGKNRFMLLQSEHIIVTMDSNMKSITDLVCPWLFSSKDYDSILHFDMEMKADDKGMEFGMNGEPYGFIPMDFEKEITFEKTTIEPYFKVHRNAIWIREYKMMINILLRLSFGAYNQSTKVHYENLIAEIADKFLIVLEEGIVLGYDKIYKFIVNEFNEHNMELPEQESLDLTCKILEVFASDRGSEYHEVEITHSDDESIPVDAPLRFSISVKLDFERDIVEILNIVNQYV